MLVDEGYGSSRDHKLRVKSSGKRGFLIGGGFLALIVALLVGLIIPTLRPPSDSVTPFDSVRGVVLEVVSPSILKVESVELLISDGTEIGFVVTEQSDMGHFTASHLRTHGLDGDTVTIYFRFVGEERVVVRIAD